MYKSSVPLVYLSPLVPTKLGEGVHKSSVAVVNAT